MFLVISRNLLKSRERWHEHGVIGFNFAWHWLKNWCEILKPVTKRSNRNRVIIFNIQLKTALSATFNLASMLAQSHSWGPWAKGGKKALETKLVNGILPFEMEQYFLFSRQTSFVDLPLRTYTFFFVRYLTTHRHLSKTNPFCNNQHQPSHINQLLYEVEQNIVICRWRADQLFADAEGRGK